MLFLGAIPWHNFLNPKKIHTFSTLLLFWLQKGDADKSIRIIIVCVAEQRFDFLHSFMYAKLLVFDTQNPEISGFQLHMRINTKPDGKQK